MKTGLLTVTGSAILIVAGAVFYIYSGSYNVSALTPYSTPVSNHTDSGTADTPLQGDDYDH